MYSIIQYLPKAIASCFGSVHISPLSSKPKGKLRLTPVQFLQTIQAHQLAQYALHLSQCFYPRRRLPRRAGGRPPRYCDTTILLMSVVQTVWGKSYEQMIDWVRTDAALAEALGFAGGLVISQGQYWQRRMQLGILPLVLFWVGLVVQLMRLGAITGKRLVVDSSLLKAYRSQDADARWQRYAGRKAVFGYKVHVVLCKQADLPILGVLTTANVHDSVVGWALLLLAHWMYGLSVQVVYADSAYFERRFLWVVRVVLGALAAVDYNLRRGGKRKVGLLWQIRAWRRRVLSPRGAIERHFAWVKRYFGLGNLASVGWLRVYQRVLLVYIGVLGVALCAYRYGRVDLARSRSGVLAHL